jgi:hypothetical protein
MDNIAKPASASSWQAYPPDASPILEWAAKMVRLKTASIGMILYREPAV